MRGVQWSTTKKSSKWWSLEISKDWKIAKDDAVSAPGMQGDVHFYVWNTLKYYILLRCFGVACLFVPSSPITSSQPLAVALYHQSNTASVQKQKGNVNRKRKCQRRPSNPSKAGHPKNVKNKCHLNAFSQQSLLWSPRAPKPATCGSTSWLSYNGYIRWNCETETKETKKHLQKSTKVKKLSGMDCAGCLQTDVLLSPSLHLMFPPK